VRVLYKKIHTNKHRVVNICEYCHQACKKTFVLFLGMYGCNKLDSFTSRPHDHFHERAYSCMRTHGDNIRIALGCREDEVSSRIQTFCISKKLFVINNKKDVAPRQALTAFIHEVHSVYTFCSESSLKLNGGQRVLMIL
jgi:hypothetical protein